MEGVSFRVESPARECVFQLDGVIFTSLPATFVTKKNELTVRVPNPWVPYSEFWRTKIASKNKKD